MTTEDQYKLATNTLNGRLFVPYQREGVQWMLGMENQSDGPKGGFYVTKWVWERPYS
jgi:hypothetical protein